MVAYYRGDGWHCNQLLLLLLLSETEKEYYHQTTMHSTMTNETTIHTNSKYSPVESSDVTNDDNDNDFNQETTTRPKRKYAPLEISEAYDEENEDDFDDDYENNDASIMTPPARRLYWILIIVIILVWAGVAYVSTIPNNKDSSTHHNEDHQAPSPAALDNNNNNSAAPVAYHPPTDPSRFTAPPTSSPKTNESKSKSKSKRTDYGEAFDETWKRMDDLDDSIVREEWNDDIHFHLAMSDDGTVLVIGDPDASAGYDENSSAYMGKAHVYHHRDDMTTSSSSSSWGLPSTMKPLECQDNAPKQQQQPICNNQDRFGHMVQLSGDASILVVGDMAAASHTDSNSSSLEYHSLFMYRQSNNNNNKNNNYIALGPEFDRPYGYALPPRTVISFSQDASRFAVILQQDHRQQELDIDIDINIATPCTVQIFEWIDKENNWVLQVNLVPFDYNIYDVAMSANGKRVVFTSNELQINAHVFDLMDDGQWIDTAVLDMSSPAANCSFVEASLEMTSNGQKILLLADCLHKPMSTVTFTQQPPSSSSPTQQQQQQQQSWSPLHWNHARHDPEHFMDMSGDGSTLALVTYNPSDDVPQGRLELFGWDDDSFWRPFESGVVFLGNRTLASAVVLSHDGSIMAIATSNGDDKQSFLDVYQRKTAV